ncbi:MAG: hypothetical protein LBP28_03745 [Coriobacteriales bacterium]|jgi:hypothetical protein|nr:hypothetical protein [Coriobacteriales bacterium]
MKTCPNCGSVTFDDMETCYDCHYCYASTLGDLPGLDGEALRMARLKVVLQGLSVYETLLRKQEGATLRVGCATGNAIVVPEPEVAEHQCSIFFSQGQLWVEAVEKDAITVIGTTPLSGPQAVIPGDSLHVGSATITVLET